MNSSIICRKCYQLRRPLHKVEQQYIRNFASQQAVKIVNHYSALGLTSKATQSEIKSAYYRLSKLYHPDISTDSEDAHKFREITAAYEILGNLKLRKMYDKGLLPHEGFQSSVRENQEEEPQSRFHKVSRIKRTQPASGKTATYDFDEWSRFHYGATFNRRNDAKEKRERMEQMMEDNKKEKQTDSILIGVFILSFILLSYNNLSVRRHDTVSIDDKKDQ